MAMHDSANFIIVLQQLDGAVRGAIICYWNGFGVAMVAKHSMHVASCPGLYCTNRTRYDELNASIDTLIYRGNASFMRTSSVQLHAVGFSENYSEEKKSTTYRYCDTTYSRKNEK